MSRAKIFVGSSRNNIRVAQLLAELIEEHAGAEVTVWDEGVFVLTRGILEGLLGALERFDFAVFVLAADDETLSNGELRFSTRDNVLFECGLFMGRLGKDRVFIAYDERSNLDIPSDFGGIGLAPYDGSRLGPSDGSVAVRKAARLISDEIGKQTLSPVVGEWRSRYRLAGEIGHPLAEDDVEISSAQGRLVLENKNNSQGDSYIATGDLAPNNRLLIGKWKATQNRGTTGGAFLLAIDPLFSMMYGYATGMDERSGTLYVSWVLAKKNGVDEGRINERLKRGEDLLRSTL